MIRTRDDKTKVNYSKERTLEILHDHKEKVSKTTVHAMKKGEVESYIPQSVNSGL